MDSMEEKIQSLEFGQKAIVRQLELLASQQQKILSQIDSIKPKEVKKAELENRFKGLLIYSNLPRSYIASVQRKKFQLIEENGHIRGAVRGNELFMLGGKHNQLTDTGRMTLEILLKQKIRVPPLDVDFYEERARCLKTLTLFEDAHFRAGPEVLYAKHRSRSVVWKRPGELVRNPGFIVDGHSRFDLNQGALNDCWFISSIAYLTLRDELFFRIVQPDNSFVDDYAGIFHFQFNRYGQWVDVVIDDRLPTIDDKLIYVKSNDEDEFWGALIEKAYAKLYGGYDNLNFGVSSDAFEDFSGGATQTVYIPKCQKTHIVPLLVNAFKMGCLIGCGVNQSGTEDRRLIQKGLTNKHVYTCTGINSFRKTSGYGSVTLIRIRNPNGDHMEWNGDYCDTCYKWEEIEEEDRDEWDVRNLEDGEFWMCPEDFMEYFYILSICQIPNNNRIEIYKRIGYVPDNIPEEYELRFEGNWSKENGTAGGLANLSEGRQYNIIFGNPDDDSEKKLEFFLMQTHLREFGLVSKAKIAFISIFPIESENEILTEEKMAQGSLRVGYFDSRECLLDPSTKPELQNDLFTIIGGKSERQFIAYAMLKPGMYAIVPTTQKAGEEGQYVLRLFSETVVLETSCRHRLPDMLESLQKRIETKIEEDRKSSSCGIM